MSSVMRDRGVPSGARSARSSFATNCPQLIAMTGCGQPDDRQRALNAGFNLHIVKPVAMPELLALLETFANPQRPPRDEEMLQAPIKEVTVPVHGRFSGLSFQTAATTLRPLRRALR